MASAGRPTKLTPELQQEIVTLLEAGNYICVVCAYVGISTSTYYDWFQQGENGVEPYSDFRVAVEKATAEGETSSVAIVLKAAGEGNWQAAMTFLERRHAARWGRRQVEHTGKGGGPIEHEHNVAFRGTPEELAEAAGEAIAEQTNEATVEAAGEEVGAVRGDTADD